MYCILFYFSILSSTFQMIYFTLNRTFHMIYFTLYSIFHFMRKQFIWYYRSSECHRYFVYKTSWFVCEEVFKPLFLLQLLSTSFFLMIISYFFLYNCKYISFIYTFFIWINCLKIVYWNCYFHFKKSCRFFSQKLTKIILINRELNQHLTLRNKRKKVLKHITES